MFEELVAWIKRDKFNILLTLFAAMLPVGISWLVNGHHKFFSLAIEPKENYLIHTVFVFSTILVLIRNFWSTHMELTEKDDKIKSYIAKDCNIKLFHNELESSFKVVRVTVWQFYIAWIIVWLLWLTYYLGNFFFAINGVEVKIFCDTLDFLTSTVIFAVYLILATVTVDMKKRLKNNIAYFYGIVLWVLIFVLWIVGVSMSNTYYGLISTDEAEKLVNLLLSLYSTITFTLVLGKINSNYLQIPKLFLWMLYLYAIIQAYHPFISDGYQIGVVGNVLNFLFPYITLFGKFFLILTLCWISNKRRFLFFVIQKSVSIDEAPVLLNDLNKECGNGDV